MHERTRAYIGLVGMLFICLSCIIAILKHHAIIWLIIRGFPLGILFFIGCLIFVFAALTEPR